MRDINAYSNVTRKNILKKVNRRRHPVANLVQLAEEFGINTTFSRSDGRTGHRAPTKFRTTVLKEVGTKAYNQIRDLSKVHAAH